MRKPAILHCKKVQISCSVTAQLISAFVFAIQIVQSNYLLNPKFQASGHPLWLHGLVCVVPGHGSHNEARQAVGLFFPYIDSTIYLIHESNISSLLQSSIYVQRDLCLNWSRIQRQISTAWPYVMGKIKGAYFFFFLNSISL